MTKKPERDIPLGIGQELCALCDHVAYFWETPGEFERGVKFLSAGLRSIDDAVVFGYGEANQRVVEVLKKEGFDTQALIKDRRLTLIDGQEDEAKMLDTIGAAFKARIDQGVERIRLLGKVERAMKEAFTDAVKRVYFVAIFMSLLALLVTFAMPALALRTRSGPGGPPSE